VRFLLPIFIAGLLVGCSHKYPYTGTIADAEPLGLIHLTGEALGDDWIRYRMVRDTSGLWITNGAATMRVKSGQVTLSGSAEVRGYIAQALKLK